MAGGGRNVQSPHPLPLRKRSFSASDRLGQEGSNIAAGLRTSSEQIRHSEEKCALFDATTIITQRIEATYNDKQHTLWFVVPETSQMSVSQLEIQLRNHLV